MVGLEIGLVVVGILIFVGSFFITEKLSSSDMQEITKISKDEIKNIVAKEVAKSDEVIDERLNMRLDDAVNDFALRTDDEYVSKMNHMNEYSENVLKTMEKTNNEIVFIHSMLSDKQEAVSEMTTQLDITKSQLLQLKKDVDEKIEELKAQYDANIKLQKEQEFVSGIEASNVESETVKSFGDELRDRIDEDESDVPDELKEAIKFASSKGGEELRLDEMLANSESSDNNADDNTMSATEAEIIKLHKEGFSEIEIAKQFGKGIGEIKLILGLYN